MAETWCFAQRPIEPCSSKDFITALLRDVPFMVHTKYPKYLNSLAPKIIFWACLFHKTFNSSQIFDAHSSYSLIKLWLFLSCCCLDSSQVDINCGPSSHPDFIKNYFLSKFASNSPFPPIPDGRMGPLMSPWFKWSPNIFQKWK